MTTQTRPLPDAGATGAAETAGAAGGPQGLEEVRGGAAGFDSLLAATPVVLAEFGADWCPPCHALEPALRRLAAEYAGRARVVSVDTERYPALAGRYGVLGLPTVVVFREGREVSRLLGLRPIGALRQILDGALAGPDGTA